jgi:hypothetical protein
MVFSSLILETSFSHRIKTSLQINKRNLQLHQRNLWTNLNQWFSQHKHQHRLRLNPQNKSNYLKQNPWPDQVELNNLLISTISVLDQISITRSFTLALNNDAENLDVKQKQW